MKVSEMPYQRITVEEFKEQAENALAADYMFKYAKPDYPAGRETHE